MTLQQLKYVVTVAECGNITEAAKQLFVSQPTVTSAIHDLEKEMQWYGQARTKMWQRFPIPDMWRFAVPEQR